MTTLRMLVWKLIDDGVWTQMESTHTILAEKSIRTRTDTSSVTSTAITETQIADNAGMYKMGQYQFDLTEKIVNAPHEVLALEKKGVLSIEESKADKKAAKGGERNEQ